MTKRGQKEGCHYEGDGELLPNYGWVQNTSNLSMVRDMVELVGTEPINHNEFMRRVYAYRTSLEPDLAKWTYDARCRARAIVATGMVHLDRAIQGYVITDLGRELINAPKSEVIVKKNRILTEEEKTIFKKGILSNPPVVQVLTLLNESKRQGRSLSKYDIGARLGYAGDRGFTHLEPEYVARIGASFNDKEGDADKWARTILSWLSQVGWVVPSEQVQYYGKKLKTYTTTAEVDNVLRYEARSISKYVPQEMLCSDKNPFSSIVQKRRFAILKALRQGRLTDITDLTAQINQDGLSIDIETVKFELANLSQAGFQISHDHDIYCMKDNLVLDEQRVTEQHINVSSQDALEKCIEHYVVEYEDSIPSRLVDSLIRYGSTGRDNCAEFEGAVTRFFTFMGYDSTQLGQGNGRVADVIARYKDNMMARSYGLIIDAKAYSKYNFNAPDVRKMKEYVIQHQQELMMEMIPRHAFAFVSMDFVPEQNALNEISNDTGVNGTAIDVFSLLELGSKTSKQEVKISEIYDSFTTNKRFVCPVSN